MVEMRNLMTDPWPSRLSWGIVAGGDATTVELRMNAAQDGIYVRTIASPPAWIGLWVNGMTPGVEYVAAIYVSGAACTLLAKDRIDGPRLASHKCTTSQTFHAIRFTPEGNRAIIAVIPPATVNHATAINRFEVMSGKDFDTMRAIKNPDGTPANIRWFAPPKSAATGVMSTPALDRGGALLGGFRWATYMSAYSNWIRRRNLSAESRAGRRCCSRRSSAPGTCSSRARSGAPTKRTLDRLQRPHLPGAYPRQRMVHDGRLGAVSSIVDRRRARQSALAAAGRGHTGIAAAADARALTVASRWEVAT